MSSSRLAVVLVATLLVASLVASIPAAGQSAEYSGEIQLTGSEAADETQFSYELGDDPDISEFNVSLTGVSNQQTKSKQGSISGSGQISIDADGYSVNDASINLKGVEPKKTGQLGSTYPHMNPVTVETDISEEQTLTEIRLTGGATETDGDSTVSVSVGGTDIGSKTWQAGTIENVEKTYYTDTTVTDGTQIEFDVSGSFNNLGYAYLVYDEKSVTVNGQSYTPTESIDLSLTNGSNIISVGQVDNKLSYNVSWTETTPSVNPTVSINDNSVGVDGTLSDGESRSLPVDPAWIDSGQNNVSITTNSPTDGLGSLVEVDYSHLTTGPSESTIVNATTWRESINTTQEFDTELANANARIKFADSVVDVTDIETSVNGGSWSSPSSWSMSGSTLNVSVGDVSAGDTVSARADGRKVEVVGGTVEIVDPTVEGATLSTRMRVTSTTSDGVEIDVSGTDPSDKIHYLASSDWSASDRARVDSGGSQVLELPNAVEDTEATVETAPLSVAPQTGEAVVEIDDAEEPRFTISPGETEGDYVEIGYRDTAPGETYELYAPDDDRVVDRATASSPVWFSAPDSSTTYTVRVGEATAAVGGMVGAGGDGSGGFGPAILIGVAMLGVIGSAYAGRRLGVSWRLSIPVGAVAAIGVAELASPTSLVATISGDLLRGSSQPLVATVVGTVLLGGLVVVDRRISWDIPRWLYGGVALASLAWIGTAVAPDLLSGSSQPLVALAAGSTVILGLVYVQWQTEREIPVLATGSISVLAAIWIAETIAPGVITGPLRTGLEEVGPLAWLAILGGGIYAIRGWIRSRNTPDTQVTLSLGRGGNE